MNRQVVVILPLLLFACGDGEAKRPSEDPDTTESGSQDEVPRSQAVEPTRDLRTESGARTVPDAPTPVETGAFESLGSGLKVAELAVGEGPLAEHGSGIRVEYTGWLEDGRVFDSSYRRREAPTFLLGTGDVIEGWEQGLMGMAVGGKRQLVIPPELAYGQEGHRELGVPGGATLTYEVELKHATEPRIVPEAPQTVQNHRTSPSGLRYADLEVGEGPVPEERQVVAVDYTGWLEDGTRFDSSLARPEPVAIPLGVGRVLQGWDEGIASMRVGGRRQLVIPPDLAYGEEGRPPAIPPNATLIFEIELVEVR